MPQKTCRSSTIKVPHKVDTMTSTIELGMFQQANYCLLIGRLYRDDIQKGYPYQKLFPESHDCKECPAAKPKREK